MLASLPYGCRLLSPCLLSPTQVLGDKYQLHDLVQLDANTAGVIIAVERGGAKVLTNQGSAIAPEVRVVKVCVLYVCVLCAVCLCAYRARVGACQGAN